MREELRVRIATLGDLHERQRAATVQAARDDYNRDMTAAALRLVKIRDDRIAAAEAEYDRLMQELQQVEKQISG